MRCGSGPVPNRSIPKAPLAAVTRIMVLPFSLNQVRLARVSNRLPAGQQRVERAVDLMLRARARVEQGLPYDDLLRSPVPDDTKVSPQVFVSLGSIMLWAGGRPRLFRDCCRAARSSIAARWPPSSGPRGARPTAQPARLHSPAPVRSQARSSDMARSDDPIPWPMQPNAASVPAAAPRQRRSRRSFDAARAAEPANALSAATGSSEIAPGPVDRLQRLRGGMGAGPGPLEIIAAEPAGDVDRLTDREQAGQAARGHRPR